jgi:hypothetical protein
MTPLLLGCPRRFVRINPHVTAFLSQIDARFEIGGHLFLVYDMYKLPEKVPKRMHYEARDEIPSGYRSRTLAMRTASRAFPLPNNGRLLVFTMDDDS